MINQVIIDRTMTSDTALELFRLNELSVLLKGPQQSVIAVDDHLIDSLEIMLLCLKPVHHPAKVFNLLLLLSNSRSIRTTLSFISEGIFKSITCLLYTSPSPRDQRGSRMPSSA